MKINFDLETFIEEKVTKRSESLLKKDLSSFNDKMQQKIDGRNVLVIGGAGSIGSAYIKAILKFHIRKLIVVDINENSLTELVRDLRSSTDYNIPDEFITYPINFGDSVFERLFRNLGPFDIIANFAAHKHVRSEKDVYSIEAMIRNNVINAKKLLDLLLEYPPEHFFCVSTDKAANPANVMGATKKLMEELVLAYSSKLPIKTARFANVAFSNGSLPLGFIKRLNKRQPLSCPLGIRRFFVSPKESGELCLFASIMGEPGDIFFPKLNEEKDMIPFNQILFDLLDILGLQVDVCSTEEEAKQKALLLTDDSTSYPVYFFNSDTSGEKSFEEFFTETEKPDLNKFVNLGVIRKSGNKNIEEVDEIIRKIVHIFESVELTKTKVIATLNKYLPTFHHIEKRKGLDQRM